MFTHFTKKISLFVLIVLTFAACQEIGPDIKPPSVDDSPLEPTGEVLRNVLIEEFTGVQCVNCPQGAEVIEGLINTYDERLIAISIHAGFFSNPHPIESQLDLSTDTGEDLDALIGPVQAYPSAAINRNSFNPGGKIYPFQTWAGYVEQELAVPSHVDIQIENSFNENSGELSTSVNIDFLKTFTDDLSLSVVITENDIIEAQFGEMGWEEDYKHKHVLRAMLTNVAGNPIPTQSAGTGVQENFTFNIPGDWNVDNCKVVAFVHHTTPDLLVLQVSEQKLL